MKPVLLIYPPFEGKNYLSSRAPFPIGPLYIAAYLKKHGIAAKVYDMSYPPTKRKTKRPDQLKTGQSNYFRFGWGELRVVAWFKTNLDKFHDVVGVSSLMSSNWSGAYSIINTIKSVSPKTTVIIGGPHATAFPDHVHAYSKADYICIGEGEEAFLNFLKGKDHEGIVETGEYKSTRKTFIQNLDSLPFPDRSLLIDDRKTRELFVTFSRGCPHRCSFCGSHLIQGRKWRHKTVDQVLAELKFYYNEWKVRKFIIEDDNPCPGPVGIKHLKEICRRVIEELPKVRFEVSHGIPVYATADKELSKLLWKAGFRRMVFPVESTNPGTLKDMQKEDTPKWWRIGLKNWTYEKNPPVQIIIGYPFVDTISTMLKTILDIYSAGCLVWASHFRLNKGTPLFERCLKVGYVSADYDPINTQAFYLETERFKLKDLKELMQIARALNYGTENGIVQVLESDCFHSFKLPQKIGDTVAEGKFKFRRNQNVFASILLARSGKFNGRPMCTFNEKSDKIIYRGQRESRVWNELIYLLTGKKNTGIKEYLDGK